MYVVLGGPDGTGKSTLVDLLVRTHPTLVHRHWRPGLLPALRSLRGGGDSGVNTTPHQRTPDGALKATVRTLYYWADFVLGYWFVVRPATRRGRVVVLERGWDDLAVDPLRYGLAGPRLAAALGRWTPRTDLTVVLAADPSVIHRRKDELTEREIDRQLRAWPAASRSRRTVVVDAGRPPTEVARAVTDLVWGEGRCAS